MAIKAHSAAAFARLVASAAAPDAPPAVSLAFYNAKDWVTGIAIPNKLLTDISVLRLYGAYKQATVGAALLAGPSRFDVKPRAKWEAWSAMKSLSPEVRAPTTRGDSFL